MQKIIFFIIEKVQKKPEVLSSAKYAPVGWNGSIWLFSMQN